MSPFGEIISVKNGYRQLLPVIEGRFNLDSIAKVTQNNFTGEFTGKIPQFEVIKKALKFGIKFITY